MGAAPDEVRPPEWVGHLTRDDLEDLFGQTTVHRGTAYQRRGAVLSLHREQEDDMLIASVMGTRRYTTRVTPDELWAESAFGDIDLTDVLSHCTCPVGEGCKHAVAAILEAQARLMPAPALRPVAAAAAPAHTWERLLDPVVRDTPAARPSVVDSTPLALHLDVAAPVPVRGRSAATHPRLRMRPLMPGANGRWIRTGISWSDVQYAHHRRPLDPDHREALTAILLAERARTHAYYSAGEWVAADTIGPSLWALLAEAAAAGVALVTGSRADQSVTLCADPATITLDITAGPSGAADRPTAGNRQPAGAPSGSVLLRPSVQVPGAVGAPVPLGSPPHGYFVEGDRGLFLARLAKPPTRALAALLDTVETLAIPAADVSRFLTQYYPALRQRATVGSSDGSVAFPEVHPPHLALRVDFESGHRTRLRWTFRYQVGTDPIDVPLLSGAPAPGLPVVARDAAAEEALLASLDILDAAPGLRVPLPGKVRPGVVIEPTLTGWSTATFVSEVLPALQAREDVEVTLVGSPLEYVEFDGAPVVSVSTHDIDAPDGFGHGRPTDRASGGASEDWFDLGITVTVADQVVALPGLLTALAHGDPRLILDDGTWFSLDRPELHALRRILDEARALQDREPDQLRINRYQAGLWEELVSLGVVAHQSQRWARSVGALLALEEMPHPAPPTGLAATLRPYQLDGFQWLSFLWDHQLGGILADDMGLGKTVQTLAMAQRALESGDLTPDAPLLVVAPTSVVATWQREAARFAPDLSVTAITQTARKSGMPLERTVAGAHVVVTSYALFRIDAEHYCDLPWSALVLDEAQFVKNHQSRTYQVARTLRAPVKVAITGTPLENSLMDLWSLLSIAAPGLFPAPQRFSEVFRRPIESGSSPEILSALRRRIRPLMLRRTKESVAADLPPKIEQVVSVPLNAAHRRIYDTHLQRERQRILGLLDDVDRNRVAILTGLTRLRQLSLDAHLVVPDAPANVRSAKVDALVEQLVEVAAEGHRCLVFSQFTGFLRIVRERLATEGIEHVYLDGRTRDRPKRIAQFTEGDAPVFLISLKAGGSGLTLTEADYVFVLDPWWNPAVEAQAIDRAHRIGQDKTVMVYRLVSEGTIEEKVVALQERKRELFSRVVDEGGVMSAPLTAEDIRGLLEG